MQDQTFDILSINKIRLDNTIRSDEVKIILALTLLGKTETGTGVVSQYILEELFHTQTAMTY